MSKAKIVVFQGGLGNQLFQYAYLCKLREKGYRPFYLNCADASHNGFEIQKYFNTDMKPCPYLFSLLYKYLARLNRHVGISLFSNEANYSLHKMFQCGYWQDIKYMPSNLPVNFKQFDIGENNRKIEQKILSSNSVSIHVRRGDYLLPPHNKVFAGICTEEYYKRALEIMTSQIDSPSFFIFSDDMEWTKKHIRIPDFDCHYIDWNTGDKSIFDMYLMSKCKANVLANSTFSYWGARLANNRCVIYPGKWFNTMKAPKIFPEGWIKI